MKMLLLVVGTLTLLVGCAKEHENLQAQAEAAYEGAYHNALISPGAKFASLPPMVQHTIRAQTGAAEIDDITRFTNANQVIYKVWYVKRDVYPPLYVGADGSVLGPDLMVEVGATADSFSVGTGAGGSELKLADLLPVPVLDTIKQRASLLDVSRIAKQTWGDRPVYIISFKDPARQPTLYIGADGTVLNTTP